MPQNHPRIYESYQRCLTYAEQTVREAAKATRSSEDGPTLETYYDVFFRIRDDVGLKEKLPSRVLMSLLEPPPNSVTTTECRGWGGMNDRFASVSSDVARTYFDRPYRIFQSNEYLGDRIVVNPESFLMYAFITAGIHVYAMPELRGLFRLYQTPNGEAEFYQDDLVRELCPAPDPARLHLYELSGWTF